MEGTKYRNLRLFLYRTLGIEMSELHSTMPTVETLQRQGYKHWDSQELVVRIWSNLGMEKSEHLKNL